MKFNAKWMAGLGAALAVAAALSVLAAPRAAPGSGPARDYPSQPITIVVTFPPGGGTDLLARNLGASLERDLGQSVIIENRPGASGNIGARVVAHSAPDGYTLLMVNSSYAINPGVFKKLDFSPEKDLTGVINVASVPSVIVAPPNSPYASLPDMLDAGRGGGRPVMYASCGNGTPQHLAGEILKQRSGAALEQVPYRGCGPALADVAAGQIDVGIVTASSAAPLIAAGRVRALAVTAPRRSTLMPDVPTVAEQGLPGYQVDQWYGVLVPSGTPGAVVEKLNQALADIMRRPQTREKLVQLGFGPTSSTAAEFQALIEADISRFGELTRRIGLQVD